jgi:hypothetical protein
MRRSRTRNNALFTLCCLQLSTETHVLTLNSPPLSINRIFHVVKQFQIQVVEVGGWHTVALQQYDPLNCCAVWD